MELILVGFVWYFFGPMMALGMFAIACFFAAANNQQKCIEHHYTPSRMSDRDYEDIFE